MIGLIPTREKPKGPIPRNRTDSILVAFAKYALVLTNDQEAHWKKGPEGKGQVIQWRDFVEVLRSQHNVAKALRVFAGEPEVTKTC